MQIAFVAAVATAPARPAVLDDLDAHGDPIAIERQIGGSGSEALP